mgnify:CR=1 FL=1
MLYLAAIAFLFMIGNYVTGFWMPQSIKMVGHGLNHLTIGLLVMVPNVVGLGAMGMSGAYGASDRAESIATVHAAKPAAT